MPSVSHEPLSDDADPPLIADLVQEWVTVPDLCDRWRVTPARVRQLIADRELLGWRVGERNVLAVPAKLTTDAGPRPDLKGTMTVLADGGMDDEEILRWLFTPDGTLPVPGAPIDALIAGHKTEVRRRAQTTAL